MKLYVATAIKQLGPLQERLSSDLKKFGRFDVTPSAQETLVSDRATCDKFARRFESLGYRVTVRKLKSNKLKG